MGSLREPLKKNGVFYFEHDGFRYTVEGGAGCYMVVRDASGIVRYRIEGSELSSDLVVRDISSGLVAFIVNSASLF